MRLLNVDTFNLEEFVYVDPPPYAILSHTWGSDSEEVSYRDVLDGRLDSSSTRPFKVTGCCKEAKSNGYQYVWIDTCCIDKTNSVELQEAINSMFRYYRDAAICYAYLTDVRSGDLNDTRSPFSSSRWFSRGWTLQELLAPLNLRFYDADWVCIGTKGELCDTVEAVTGIPSSYLLGLTELHHASVAQRMSWAAKRVTKRQEDIAYCLLGIFGVSMPMIYGEGDKAFRRLQEQIMKDLGDDSILAWDIEPEGPADPSPDIVLGTALAPAPSYFARSGHIVAADHHTHHSSFEVNGGSVRLTLPLYTESDGFIFGLLKCGVERHGEMRDLVGIPLIAASGGQPNKYFRIDGRQAKLLRGKRVTPGALIHIQLDGGRKSPSQTAGPCWIHIRRSVSDLELISVHPPACWHKERALIEVAADLATDGVRRTLARFQHYTMSSPDFVAVFEVDAQSRPLCSLMVASRNTSLHEIADHPDAWRNMIQGKKDASNGGMNLGIALEALHASSPQRSFVLKLAVLPQAPPATVSATAALRLSGARALVTHLETINELRKLATEELHSNLRWTKHRMAELLAQLEEVRLEIGALQKEERQLSEVYGCENSLEQKLAKKFKQARNAELDNWRKIRGMQQFIDFWNNGSQHSPEDEEALSETAESVLPLAVEQGYDSFARLLIEEAASVTAKDASGMTPLDHAVWRGETELARLLLRQGAVATSPKKDGTTPLHVAARRGDEPMARLLLENGASLIAKDSKGDTPLDLAVREKHDRLVPLLTPDKETDDAAADRTPASKPPSTDASSAPSSSSTAATNGSSDSHDTPSPPTPPPHSRSVPTLRGAYPKSGRVLRFEDQQYRFLRDEVSDVIVEPVRIPGESPPRVPVVQRSYTYDIDGTRIDRPR